MGLDVILGAGFWVDGPVGSSVPFRSLKMGVLEDGGFFGSGGWVY